jgi:transcriptional regulator with XRE-family HTH domain
MSNTLNIGSKISTLRKEKGWSQSDLAQKIDASREIIGKYEHNENLPSNKMVAKMAKAFGVTVDFLIGEGENDSYDKETVERINDIQKMDADTKSVLFNVIDTCIQNFKTKKLLDKITKSLIRWLCCFSSLSEKK